MRALAVMKNVGGLSALLGIFVACAGCGASIRGTVRDEAFTTLVKQLDVIVASSGMTNEFNAEEAKALTVEARRRGLVGSTAVIHKEQELNAALASAAAKGAQAVLITRVDTVMVSQYGNSLGAHMNVSMLALGRTPKLVWRAKIYNPWMVDENHDGFAETVFNEMNNQRLIR